MLRGMVIDFAGRLGALGSISLWLTVEALDGRNAPYDDASCDPCVYKCALELALPVLFVVSIVEGLARFVLGLLPALAFSQLRDLGLITPEMAWDKVIEDVTYTGGLLSLKNAVCLLMISVLNITKDEIDYDALMGYCY